MRSLLALESYWFVGWCFGELVPTSIRLRVECLRSNRGRSGRWSVPWFQRHGSLGHCASFSSRGTEHSGLTGGPQPKCWMRRTNGTPNRDLVFRSYLRNVLSPPCSSTQLLGMIHLGSTILACTCFPADFPQWLECFVDPGRGMSESLPMIWPCSQTEARSRTKDLHDGHVDYGVADAAKQSYS